MATSDELFTKLLSDPSASDPSLSLSLNALDLQDQGLSQDTVDINKQYDRVGEELAKASQSFQERQNQLGLLQSGQTSSGLQDISVRQKGESEQERASKLANVALQRSALRNRRAQVIQDSAKNRVNSLAELLKNDGFTSLIARDPRSPLVKTILEGYGFDVIDDLGSDAAPAAIGNPGNDVSLSALSGQSYSTPTAPVSSSSPAPAFNADAYRASKGLPAGPAKPIDVTPYVAPSVALPNTSKLNPNNTLTTAGATAFNFTPVGRLVNTLTSAKNLASTGYKYAKKPVVDIFKAYKKLLIK